MILLRIQRHKLLIIILTVFIGKPRLDTITAGVFSVLIPGFITVRVMAQF